MVITGYSSSTLLTCGVPQGSVLRPLLFTLLIMIHLDVISMLIIKPSSPWDFPRSWDFSQILGFSTKHACVHAYIHNLFYIHTYRFKKCILKSAEKSPELFCQSSTNICLVDDCSIWNVKYNSCVCVCVRACVCVWCVCMYAA